MKTKWFVVSILLLVGAIYCNKISANTENPPQIVSLEGENQDRFYINGNSLTITGSRTAEQKKADAKEFEQRAKLYRYDVQGEIYRRWKLAVDVEKFKNAIMLERAGAPVTVVNTTNHQNVEAVRVTPQVQ